VLLTLAAALTPVLAAAAQPLSGNSWKIAPQAETTSTGQQISMPGYPSGSWVAAQVPGTVFGSYVKAGLEKEPTYGDNISKVDRAKYDRNFWYRAEFIVPLSDRGGKVWLNLDAVNRDADVYVNGRNTGCAVA